jgi:uncharacterized protein
MARKKTQLELTEYLDSMVQKLSKAANIDEIILFGSYAKGCADDYSDVDIAIVSSDFKSNNASLNALGLVKKIKLYDPDLQLVGFKSSSYNNEDEWIHPEFIREIKRTGKLLYRNPGP